MSQNEAPSQNFERQVAKKVRIGDLLTGIYVREEGWKPNYIQTPKGNISRVQLVGIIVGEEKNTLILDDGSGTIPVRSFDGEQPSYGIGTIVRVIGRPREFSSQRFISPEIIKVIKDTGWLDLHKKETNGTRQQEPAPVVEENVEEEFTSPLTTAVYETIRSLDTGGGVDIQDIVNKHGAGSEIVIHQLIERGEIYEIKKGRLQVLS